MKRFPLLIALLVAMAGMGSLYSNAAYTQTFLFNPIYDVRTPLDWGGEYHRIEGLTQTGWVRLHYVKFNADLLQPDVVVAGNAIGSVSSVEDMTREAGAVIGINANFYDPNSNSPIGFILDDGEILSAPYSDRATLAMEFFGRYHVLNPKIDVVFKTSEKNYIINGVNRSLYDHALILYTPQHGAPRFLSSSARVVGIRQNRVAWNGSAPVPSYLVDVEDISWLVAMGSAVKILEALELTEAVKIDYLMEPERFLIRDAIQAGPRLLNAGHNALLRSEGFTPNFIQRPAARSALALTSQNELLLVVVTSGNGSVGMGLHELAEYLRDLGAVEAMALDGGGSSSLVFKQGSTWRNVGGTREVPVGLVFTAR